MGTLCTSPAEYSETRNQPPDLFRRPSFLPVQRKTDGPLSGAARLPGGMGMNVSNGSIAPFGTLSGNDRYLREGDDWSGCKAATDGRENGRRNWAESTPAGY